MSKRSKTPKPVETHRDPAPPANVDVRGYLVIEALKNLPGLGWANGQSVRIHSDELTAYGRLLKEGIDYKVITTATQFKQMMETR